MHLAVYTIYIVHTIISSRYSPCHSVLKLILYSSSEDKKQFHMHIKQNVNAIFFNIEEEYHVETMLFCAKELSWLRIESNGRL